MYRTEWFTINLSNLNALKMSAQLSQPQTTLCGDGEEIDWDEIDWDEFAQLDMIDDLSDAGVDMPEEQSAPKKPLPMIDTETQTLMDVHKGLLKWVAVTIEQPACEYPEKEYPLLSTKIEFKGRNRFIGKGKPVRLSPPVLYTQPNGFNFKVEMNPVGAPRPKKAKSKKQGVQPLMGLDVQPPKKVLNKLCFSFFNNVKCTKYACSYAHSIKEVDANTFVCRSFAKTAKCPWVEVVHHSIPKKLRFLKNTTEGRICFGRHNHAGSVESVHSYIGRTTTQFDVVAIAKQRKATREARKAANI